MVGPLFREQSPPVDARPGLTPARSRTTVGYPASRGAIHPLANLYFSV
jgi:hypothetical protein